MLTDEIFQIVINEAQFSYALSSGPGGQNVNKNQTKAVLRWNLTSSKIPDLLKSKLFKKLKYDLTKLGDLVISSQSSRSRDINEKTCRKKLLRVLEKALTEPKKRVPTRPTRSSVKSRLDQKKKLSTKKDLRKKVSLSED